MKIAVIGGGAAGLSAAYYLNQKHEVTLFEKADRPGGHAHTYIIPDGPDQGTPLDLGFMVLNDKNYPTMHQFLSDLGVRQIGQTEMSFSYWDQSSNFHYGLNFDIENSFTKSTFTGSGTASQKNLLSILRHILKFMDILKVDLKAGVLGGKSIKEYINEKEEISDRLYNNYILPMASGIWSTPPHAMGAYPIEALVNFYSNHGLIDIETPPQWQYIKGGSLQYVQQVAKAIGKDNICLNSRIKQVIRNKDGVQISFEDGSVADFDKVFFATHSDTSLSLLGDASKEESELLSAWNYQDNLCVLHSDESLMPPKDSWASWNYISDKNEIINDKSFCMTYHLNRLQGHFDTERQYFLTVNPVTAVSDKLSYVEINMRHPQYSLQSFEAQKKLSERNGTNNTFFCGSYMGHGFHEDAIKSGYDAVQRLLKNE